MSNKDSHKKTCETKKKTCIKKVLEGYRFCSKHILEDPKAPFIQCEYISVRTNLRCTNPLPLKYFENLANNNNRSSTSSVSPYVKYCVSHRHLLDANIKKRLLEETHSSLEPSVLTPSKKLQRVLEKQGIFKGKSYDLYKKLNNNEIRFDDSFYNTFHHLNQSNQSNITTTTTTTTTKSDNNNNNNNDNNNNNNNNNNSSTITNETNYFNPGFLEDEVLGLYKGNERDLEINLYDSFDSDFYFSQSPLLTEEEVIQRKKIYISKLILLYKKQYDRYIERLRILRRHYITSTLHNNTNNNNNEQQQQQQQQQQEQEPIIIDKEEEEVKVIEKPKIKPRQKPKPKVQKKKLPVKKRKIKRKLKDGDYKDSEDEDNSEEEEEEEEEESSESDFTESSEELSDSDDSSFESDEMDQDEKCKSKKCFCKPILASKYCFAHILEDKNQKLFTGCNYLIGGEKKCNYPVLKLLIPALCLEHSDIYNSNIETIKTLPKQQKLLMKQQLSKQQPLIDNLPSPIQK
ncbi:hypothetical protein DLAC_05161 [Tieghemostelium lacteum]|uniref:KANL2-like probable zinc-finger domain-containing protein n=1 Tax=Tieghemostelium lacteum TaxID=361077 RepID=A0A151ZIE3_TIELA|nr:hypothetical protein DLAC_05161 [Tieghemostelium lacteum]|eukprot:KYQ93771.1 hypothetical protein DLAC_05161 [Tieghemostelium lacteum]